MSLIPPLVITIIFILLIAYWNYDPYVDLSKRTKGYKYIIPEPYEMQKHNISIYGPSISGKTTFKNDFCNLNETVNVFCIAKK